MVLQRPRATHHTASQLKTHTPKGHSLVALALGHRRGDIEGRHTTVQPKTLISKGGVALSCFVIPDLEGTLQGVIEMAARLGEAVGAGLFIMVRWVDWPAHARCSCVHVYQRWP